MRLACFVILILSLVGCSDVADKPLIMPKLPLPTQSIADFGAMVGNRGVDIRDSVVLCGRVVSSDADQNFYGSIVVEDDTAAVEVMLGLSSLDAIYPPGLYVALQLYNCYADHARGVLQVGRRAEEYNYYGVGNLGSRELADRVVLRSMDVKPVEARPVVISELSHDMCGMLVQLRDIELVDSSTVDTLAGGSLEQARWSGYSLFKDRSGDSIALYTRDYARYADSYIPQARLSITGILQYDKYHNGKECFFVKMRYENDCTIL